MPQQINALEQQLMQRETPKQDPTIENAIGLLSDDEKPTVPVETYHDPKKLFEEVLKKFGPTKPSSKAIGIVPYDKSKIYINKNAEEYNDPYRLASKLVHEQYHVVAPKFTFWESPAYERELGFINKHPVNFKPDYKEAIEKIYKQFVEREKAQGMK